VTLTPGRLLLAPAAVSLTGTKVNTSGPRCWLPGLREAPIKDATGELVRVAQTTWAPHLAPRQSAVAVERHARP
jgi:hypothetical protein